METFFLDISCHTPFTLFPHVVSVEKGLKHSIKTTITPTNKKSIYFHPAHSKERVAQQS
jgi:hypothetical protein